MATWFIEVLAPSSGSIGGAPSARCLAVGVALAGYAVWSRRRTPAPIGVQHGPLDAEHGDGLPLAVVAGGDR